MFLQTCNEVGFVAGGGKRPFLKKLLQLRNLERGVFGHGERVRP